MPEPELTLVVTSRGAIVGYTIGNDMSSRDIEGENPLYLPQAKVYDAVCALGPAVLAVGRCRSVIHGHSPDDHARRTRRLRWRDDAGVDEAQPEELVD